MLEDPQGMPQFVRGYSVEAGVHVRRAGIDRVDIDANGNPEFEPGGDGVNHGDPFARYKAGPKPSRARHDCRSRSDPDDDIGGAGIGYHRSVPFPVVQFPLPQGNPFRTRSGTED